MKIRVVFLPLSKLPNCGRKKLQTEPSGMRISSHEGCFPKRNVFFNNFFSLRSRKDWKRKFIRGWCVHLFHCLLQVCNNINLKCCIYLLHSVHQSIQEHNRSNMTPMYSHILILLSYKDHLHHSTCCIRYNLRILTYFWDKYIQNYMGKGINLKMWTCPRWSVVGA